MKLIQRTTNKVEKQKKKKKNEKKLNEKPNIIMSLEDGHVSAIWFFQKVYVTSAVQKEHVELRNVSFSLTKVCSVLPIEVVMAKTKERKKQRAHTQRKSYQS